MSYQISLTEAGTYLSNLLRESNLSTVPRNISIGGTFAKPKMPSGTGKGLMNWFNLNGVGPGAHQFYITYQEYPNPGNNVGRRLPIGNEELFKPGESFTYNHLGGSVQDCENYIKTQNTGKTPSSQLITKSTVETNARKFLKDFPRDPS